jgi:uncharacterized membrane protein
MPARQAPLGSRIATAMSLPKLCIIALAALACVQMAHFYPLIVAHPMASHFNVAGAPNGWQPKEVFFGTYFVMLVMLGAIFLVAPALLYRMPPSAMNWPYKEYWLAPERRAQTLRRFIERFQWLGATALAFIIAMMQSVLQTNTTDEPHLPTDHVLIPLGIYFALMLVQIVGVLTLFRRPPLEASER